MTAKATWIVDPGHSEVQFKVKHLAIAYVKGCFRKFNGAAVSNDDTFNTAEVQFNIESMSVDTNNSDRDKHLISDIFLHTEQFPAISFEGVLQNNTGTYSLSGDLTIRGITKRISFEVDHTGIGKGRFNDVRAGFEVIGKINRHDFGLNFNLMTEVGSLVVGEEITISCNIELIRQ